MIAFDKILGQLFQGAEKIVEKGKKVSSEGVDITKELFTDIAGRTADVTSLARYKYDLMSLRKQFEAELFNLGSALVAVQRNKDLAPDDEMFQPQMQKLTDLDGSYGDHPLTLLEPAVVRVSRRGVFIESLYVEEKGRDGEAFVTGTFGALTPVATVDGHPVGEGEGAGPVTSRLGSLYREAIDLAAGR